MKVFTIGFTKKNAEQLFSRLEQSGLVRLIDARLNNVSHFAGFTKKDDLRFFLSRISGIDYLHRTDLAPTKDILDEHQKGDRAAHERRFLELMTRRKIEITVPKQLIDGACLLCSEPTPEHCRRRFVAEYLRSIWGDLEIRDL